MNKIVERVVSLGGNIKTSQHWNYEPQKCGSGRRIRNSRHKSFGEKIWIEMIRQIIEIFCVSLLDKCVLIKNKNYEFKNFR